MVRSTFALVGKNLTACTYFGDAKTVVSSVESFRIVENRIRREGECDELRLFLRRSAVVELCEHFFPKAVVRLAVVHHWQLRPKQAKAFVLPMVHYGLGERPWSAVRS